ncbi:MFS transporter [Pigmentiphaga soli]|uniref:MFS transporter n=1 Tax=Pigmentiphaga soli TaxID=1007095 RepID=A0ABP8H847_9BURK
MTVQPAEPRSSVFSADGAGAIAGVLLVAANLRAPLTGVGPLLGQIRESTGLSAAAAGFLNTLPIAVFALFSLVAAAAGRRLGIERALFLAMVLLAAGIALRSLPGLAWLYGGTLLLGVAIGIGNVILPSVVKRDFARRIGTLTGMYAMVMTFAAGMAAGLAVPLAQALAGGWRRALDCWCVLAAAAALAWRRRARQSPPPPAAHAASHAAPVSVWRSPIAWQVTLFMGIQALNFYTLVAWLPSMVSEIGIGAAAAGWLLAMMQMTALLASVLVPLMLARISDHRRLALGVSLLCMACFAGLALTPGWTLAWIALSGLALGCSLVLSLAFIGLRAANAQQAAALSGMVQGLGYLIAAAGPVVCGLLRDHTGSWQATLWLMAALAAVQGWASFQAGRRRFVGQA